MQLEVLAVIGGTIFIAYQVYYSRKNIESNTKERTHNFFIKNRQEFIQVSNVVRELIKTYPTYQAYQDFLTKKGNKKNKEEGFCKNDKLIKDHMYLLNVLEQGVSNKIYDEATIKIQEPYITEYYEYIESYIKKTRKIKGFEDFQTELSSLYERVKN